jgi:putative membrane protein
MKLRFFVLPCCLLALHFTSVRGIWADEPPKTGVPAMGVGDEAFILKASQGGMAEVQLGKLAAQKATRADVREFGALMAADHTKANEDLRALARRKGLTLPEQLDAAHAGAVDNLSKLEGGQFDRAYIESMVKDHQEDVAEFQEAAKVTKDAELRAFIVKTLPTLQTHLRKIEAIAAAKAK